MAQPDITARQAKDGYSSGDLGDVSQFYATEVPDEKESDSDSETMPRKTFKERYAMASSKDKNDLSNLPGQVVIPDKPVSGIGVAMDNDGAGSQDVKMIVSEAPPIQEDEGSDLPSEDLVDRILEAMWGYSHAYHISNSVGYTIID